MLKGVTSALPHSPPDFIFQQAPTVFPSMLKFPLPITQILIVCTWNQSNSSYKSIRVNLVFSKCYLPCQYCWACYSDCYSCFFWIFCFPCLNHFIVVPEIPVCLYFEPCECLNCLLTRILFAVHFNKPTCFYIHPLNPALTEGMKRFLISPELLKNEVKKKTYEILCYCKTALPNLWWIYDYLL